MTIANLEKLCRLIKNNNYNLPSSPLLPAKLKVLLHRKSHLTTAVIFSINFPLREYFSCTFYGGTISFKITAEIEVRKHMFCS